MNTGISGRCVAAIAAVIQLAGCGQTDTSNAADYEKALLPYESVPGPKIISVTLDVQLYPRQVHADTVGSYLIENRTGQPLSLLHVRWMRPLELQEMDVGKATLEKEYEEFNYRIYRLAVPMAPKKDTPGRRPTCINRGRGGAIPDCGTVDEPR